MILAFTLLPPFCVHAEVPAKKGRAPNPSCPLRNRNKAVRFVQQCHNAQNGTKHMANPNQRTKADGTNPYIFSIHAEVPANKDGTPTPSRSRDNMFELAVSSSHATVRKMDQNRCVAQMKGPPLPKPIQTSSVYMLKCSQTRRTAAIHLVHEESQQSLFFVQPVRPYDKKDQNR